MNLGVDADRLEKFRTKTYRINSYERLRSQKDAIQFVDERGFVFFWPIKGALLPSIWIATAGDRPVPNKHHDPGHVCWGWKDTALDKKVWYYGRILRQRNTMISMAIMPYFYALSPNFGDPENDYLLEYKRGEMSLETKQVYETLLRYGSLDSLSLRREARLIAPDNNSRFDKAMRVLQAQFRILPTGIAETGSWHYAFIYSLTHTSHPDLPEQARSIPESRARSLILMKYIQSVGAASYQQVHFLLGWTKEQIHTTVQDLKIENCLVDIIPDSNLKETVIALPSLLA